MYPLTILWFGIGDASKIFIIALAASFPVILNTFAGVRNVDANLFRAARSLGASEIEIFKGIVLPGSLPHIFTGVRLAWGISLIVIIAAEMVGATEGIGYMVLEAQQTFRIERVFAGIFVIGVDRLCDRSRFPPFAPGPDPMVSRDRELTPRPSRTSEGQRLRRPAQNEQPYSSGTPALRRPAR